MLTKLEKFIIKSMKKLNFEDDLIIWTLFRLQAKDEQIELLIFLKYVNLHKLTSDLVIDKVMEISRSKNI